jgi:FAD:protein FMN transferase
MAARQTRVIMGMPITVEVAETVTPEQVNRVFDYFHDVDRRFSTYKDDSEIAAFNRFGPAACECSTELLDVLALAEKTKSESAGYFDVKRPDGKVDPSGIVKGWAIQNAACMLHKAGLNNFYIDAGGDIAAFGKNNDGEDWSVGIRNPFNSQEIVKALRISNCGIATSGTYVRGQHIYDPYRPGEKISEIASLTVIGPDVLEADRFATAAFAMGQQGIYFIEERQGLEGYVIDHRGVATQTTGFGAYVIS